MLRFDGASGVTRTPDLLITNQLLYRLSYTSIKWYLKHFYNTQAKSIIAHASTRVNKKSSSFCLLIVIEITNSIIASFPS